MSVYYINVGQGDAEYIELPNGENILIDGGPNSSISQTNPLIAFLDSKGITKINHVILSHPHSDHYAGLSAVFGKYTVEKYYDSFLNGSSTANTFREKAKSNIAVKYYDTVNEIPNGTVFYATNNTTPTVSMIMLHKGDAFGTSPPSANDNSLVIKVVFGSSTFFFGGDAGAGGSYKPLEGWLVNNYSAAVLRSDCYKTHHHGSATSSSADLLNVLKPQYAFMEVGPNSYGHPTQEAIDRLNDAGVKRIYYTGYNPYGSPDGTVQVTTTGDGIYAVTPNYISPKPDKPAVTISATPSSIASGQTSTLSWSSTDATSVTITPDIGTVGPNGSKQVTPVASISYTAVATGPGGVSALAYTSITVDNKTPPPPPQPGQQPESQPELSSYIVLFNNLFHPDRQEGTEFQYYISQAGRMDVKVYTLDGELVKEYERYDANQGTYFWAWNGKNSVEDTVAAGVYILKIKTADDETIKKAILIR